MVNKSKKILHNILYTDIIWLKKSTFERKKT